MGNGKVPQMKIHLRWGTAPSYRQSCFCGQGGKRHSTAIGQFPLGASGLLPPLPPQLCSSLRVVVAFEQVCAGLWDTMASRQLCLRLMGLTVLLTVLALRGEMNPFLLSVCHWLFLFFWLFLCIQFPLMYVFMGLISLPFTICGLVALGCLGLGFCCIGFLGE